MADQIEMKIELVDEWFGITADGKKVRITHSKLMDWARANNMQFQIGWGDHATIKGTRLARSADAARKAGWNDLADEMEAMARGGCSECAPE